MVFNFKIADTYARVYSENVTFITGLRAALYRNLIILPPVTNLK